MASNLFSDFSERVELIQKYSKLDEIIPLMEETFGDPKMFANTEEAKELYIGALDEIGKLCAKEIAPNAEKVDSEGCHFENGTVKFPEALENNFQKLAELGVFSAGVWRRHDGMNFPAALLNMTLELLAHACPNTGLNIANFSMQNFFQQVATPEQIEKYMPKFMSFEWLTSMALTEAGAGSDLGQLRTHARKEGDKWLITGTKQFISGGHAEISFVLARTDPNSKGLEGLSVLICPLTVEGKEQGNFKVSKIEDKICLHGSPTCELVFEDSEAELLGKEGEGFRVMLKLMNEARLAMGALALGISVDAMEKSKEYAKTRVTMGKPIIQHPMVADMIYEMEIETRAMRFLLAEGSHAHDMLMVAREKDDKELIKKWKRRYIRLTPLVKYYCSEKCIQFTRNAVQILGGYGVCKEYPAERLYRESLIYPIYEGTSQIQSLMVLKDTLKDVATQSTGFLSSLAGAWAESKIARDPVKAKLLEARNELNLAIRTIVMGIIKNKFKSDIDSLKEQKIQDFLKDFSLKLLTPDTDLTYPFLCAERLTRIVCDYYVLKCMVDRYEPGDMELSKWILEFAELALPRMRMENEYIINRLPSTLGYIEELKKEANA